MMAHKAYIDVMIVSLHVFDGTSPSTCMHMLDSIYAGVMLGRVHICMHLPQLIYCILDSLTQLDSYDGDWNRHGGPWTQFVLGMVLMDWVGF